MKCLEKKKKLVAILPAIEQDQSKNGSEEKQKPGERKGKLSPDNTELLE